VVAHQLENVLVGTSWMKISILKRKLPGRRNRPQRKTRLEPTTRIINPIGHSMNAYSSIKSTEVVLQHCFKKTKNTDREQAMHYGRLSGYFDETNGLTRSGEYLAQFLQLDLAHERAG
jgi:hypothetical protein